jgi:hypothetical protein
MMEKPQVRIVDGQRVEDGPAQVSQSEADYLLAKYGFKTTHQQAPAPQPQDGRTFAEMVRDMESRDMPRADRPRALTFDDGSVRHAETRWASLEDEGGAAGLGFQVTIVTDMKI